MMTNSRLDIRFGVPVPGRGSSSCDLLSMNDL